MNTTVSKVYSEGRADYATANALLASRIFNAGVAYVRASESSIGGPFWTSVTLSLDPKTEWNHGILQNSRHARFAVTVEGKVGARVARDEARFVVECFSGASKRDFPSKAFRKFRAKTLEEVADRLADWALVNNLPAHEAAKRVAA